MRTPAQVHVTVHGGHGGRRVGTWGQALLVQKQKAVPVIRVDNITLKVGQHTLIAHMSRGSSARTSRVTGLHI